MTMWLPLNIPEMRHISTTFSLPVILVYFNNVIKGVAADLPCALKPPREDHTPGQVYTQCLLLPSHFELHLTWRRRGRAFQVWWGISGISNRPGVMLEIRVFGGKSEVVSSLVAMTKSEDKVLH